MLARERFVDFSDQAVKFYVFLAGLFLDRCVLLVGDGQPNLRINTRCMAILHLHHSPVIISHRLSEGFLPCLLLPIGDLSDRCGPGYQEKEA